MSRIDEAFQEQPHLKTETPPILDEANALHHVSRRIHEQILKARLDLPVTVRLDGALVRVTGSYSNLVVTVEFHT